MGKFNITRFAFICIWLVLMKAKGCLKNGDGSNSTEIVIGVNLYESGKGRTQNKYLSHAYKMAISEVNDAGGLNFNGVQIPVRLVWTDEAAPELGVQQFEELITSHGVDFLLGGYGSTQVGKEAAIANEHGVPYVNGGGATSTIYTENEWAFGILSPIRKLAETTMTFLEKAIQDPLCEIPCSIVLLWEDAAHGKEYREAVLDYVNAKPELFEIVYQSNFAYPNVLMSPGDFTPLINDMKSLKRTSADILLVDAHSPEFVNMQEELSEYDFDFKFISYGARGTDIPDLERLSFPGSSNALVAAQWWSAGAKNVHSRSFIRRWRRHEAQLWIDEMASSMDKLSASFASPEEQLVPSWVGATGYEAARTLLRAISSANSINCAAVRQALYDTNITDSILSGGQIVFSSENRQLQNDFTLVQNLDNDADNAESEAHYYTTTLYPESERTGNFSVVQPWISPKPLCSRKWWSHNFNTKCNAANKNEITYFWIGKNGRACEDSKEPCHCSGGKSLPLDFQVECVYMTYLLPEAKATLAFSIVGMIFSVGNLIMVLWNYSHPIMKAGQREFLVVMCISASWLNTSSLYFVGQSRNNFGCNTRMFMLWIPMVLLLGTLTVKIYRIYKIYTGGRNGLRRVIISVTNMIFLLCMILFGALVIWSIWVLVDPPQLKLKEEKVSDESNTNTTVATNTETVTYDACEYFNSAVFPSLLGIYTAFLVVYCNVLSYKGRIADKKHLESKAIMFASYIISFVAVSILAIIVTGDLKESVSITLFAMGTCLTSLIFIGFVVLPKFYCVYYGEISQAQRSTTTVAEETGTDEH